MRALAEDVGAVTDTFAYDELAKVNAVKTFQNELVSFKVGRDAVSFRSLRKCPALESSLAVIDILWVGYGKVGPLTSTPPTLLESMWRD